MVHAHAHGHVHMHMYMWMALFQTISDHAPNNQKTCAVAGTAGITALLCPTAHPHSCTLMTPNKKTQGCSLRRP